MNGHPYYQQRMSSLSDRILHYDYAYPVAGYWDWEAGTSEEVYTPMSDVEVIDPMSNWAEYGPDYIGAGPISFPSSETYPSQQEQLRAQEAVQTVCPLDLLLSCPVQDGDMQMDVNSSASELELGSQEADILNFGDSMDLEFVHYGPEVMYQGPIQHHAPSQQVSEPPEDNLDEDAEGDTDLDLTQADSSSTSALNPDSPAVAPAPGQVTLVDSDGEEFEAYMFESIVDSRRVANRKGGIEYFIQWTGYPSPSWQPARDLRDNLDEIMDFHDRMGKKPGPPQWVLRALRE